jgi:hypothetical protein
MRPKKITVTGVATSNWIPVDYRQDPCNIGIACQVVSGTATYSVEHTYDDIFDATVTPVAYQHAVLAAQTTSKDGAYTTPIRAVRLNITGGASPVVSMTVIQGDR